MSTVFDSQIDQTIGIEGGYTDDPGDSGGATIWGITEADARAFGYVSPMQQMPRSTAFMIYQQRYVAAPQLEALAAIDPVLADRLFDAGVNCGPQTAGKWVQRALNVLNLQGQFYPNVKVDGDVWELSRAALKHLYDRRGDDGRAVLHGMFVSQQSVHYLELAETSPSQERFEFGWQLNRALGAVTVSAFVTIAPPTTIAGALA